MTIEITALDTLFFRDGKPFEKGDDVWATGIFPPLPSVIYGALRSAYLGQNSDLTLDEVETATAGLRIQRIWYRITAEDELGSNDYNYVVAPLDLVQKKNLNRVERLHAKDYRLYPTHALMQEMLAVPSSAAAQKNTELLTTTEQVEVQPDTFITDDNFKNYLAGKAVRRVYQFRPQGEAKVGIARSNATRTSSEGNLYRVGMLRADKISIWVEFTGLALQKTGLLQLGGERKLAYYKSPRLVGFTEPPLPDFSADEQPTFRLCLMSPAIFDNGYYPTKIFKRANVEVDLLTAAVGKAINVGGFDIAQQRPKTMYKAVPAGSVYYFKLLKGKMADLQQVVRTERVCEVRGNEGFGLAYIGKI